MLWAVEQPASALHHERREHVLPTGQMHLVVRLRDDPLRIFAGPHDRIGTLLGHALIGGARDTFYSRDVSGPQCSVGAQLRPGGAEALFGIPAEEFASRHTRLDEVWGAAAGSLMDRLAGLPLAARVDALEATLLAVVSRPRAMHPAVAQALSHFSVRADVGRVIAATGYSHRTFLTLFRRSVGLAPKQYAGVVRFTRALEDLRAGHGLADVAIEAGYSDQAHFSREFRRCTGMTPREYRRIAPPSTYHLPTG
jgi:AraC-like DNA-binding protein